MEARTQEHRRGGYKAKGAFKQEELRRRREEQNVEIRRQKREESIAKRRNLNIQASFQPAESEDESSAAIINNQVRSPSFFLPNGSPRAFSPDLESLKIDNPFPTP